MQPLGCHLCFDLVTARHNETLGERIESAHDCKTDKNSQKFNNSSRNWTDSLLCRASASAPLPTSEVSLVKRCHMMCHVKNYQSLKVTITSSKKEKKQTKKETQTKESSRASCQPRMSAYFSLGVAVGSPVVFSVQESNTLQSPPSELRALVPRSLLRNRAETLATHSRNRLLVCSGIIGKLIELKLNKTNKQTKKDGKDKEVTKRRVTRCYNGQYKLAELSGIGVSE